MGTLSKRLKECRLTSGMTQKALAKRCNMAQATIAEIESGRNQGSTRIAAIAKALGVNALWLAEGKGEKYPGKTPIDQVVLDRFIYTYSTSSKASQEFLLDAIKTVETLETSISKDKTA